jgi:hypothetical protein
LKKILAIIMKRAVSILAALLAIPACAMAQALPTMPPAGYDQGGFYPAGMIRSVSHYSPSHNGLHLKFFGSSK